MTEKIVELIRRFAPMSSRSRDRDFLMPWPGRPRRWHEIEDDFRVLIIADPGADQITDVSVAYQFSERCFFCRAFWLLLFCRPRDRSCARGGSR